MSDDIDRGAYAMVLVLVAICSLLVGLGLAVAWQAMEAWL